jgi:hypothetical protein
MGFWRIDTPNGFTYTYKPDVPTGAIAVTISQQGTMGAIQCEGVLRLNRDAYLAGKGLLECLALEDRYIPVFRDVDDWETTYQEALGYPPCNFPDPAQIQFLPSPQAPP